MTQSQIEQSLNHLNNLVIEGKLINAFEMYYHDDIEMQENNLAPTVSKNGNRQRELEFLDNLVEFRKAQVKGMCVNGNLSFVIWEYDYTHKEWGVRNYIQVSIQQWKDNKIIKEIFIYNN